MYTNISLKKYIFSHLTIDAFKCAWSYCTYLRRRKKILVLIQHAPHNCIYIKWPCYVSVSLGQCRKYWNEKFKTVTIPIGLTGRTIKLTQRLFGHMEELAEYIATTIAICWDAKHYEIRSNSMTDSRILNHWPAYWRRKGKRYSHNMVFRPWIL